MNGVINLYKESGTTSFSAVDCVRKLAGGLKCGHLGTLDPMAEGVLPICVGYATRFADYLSAVEKEYVAEFKLGMSTDSFDSTGTVLSENLAIKPSEEEIRKIFSGLHGEVCLEVPAFSAKKIGGVRAYKLAREGSIANAGTAVMHIISCELMHYEYPLGLLKVCCGKGTYIRSLIAEAGKIAGCGAVMSGLVRTSNGPFKAKDCFRLSVLEEMAASGRLAEAVIPVTDLLDWGRAMVKDEAVKQVMNGVSPFKNEYLYLPLEKEGNDFFIENNAGVLLGVGRRAEHSSYPIKIKMVFN